MKFFSKKQDDELFTIIEEAPQINNHTNTPQPQYVLTPEEILGFSEQTAPKTDSTSALDALKKRMTDAANSEEQIPETKPAKQEPILPKQPEPMELKEEEEPKSSLLDKCMPYIIDEDGSDASVDKEPLYKLQSVADILKSDSEKALEKLSKNYEVYFDDLKSPKNEPEAYKEPENEAFEEAIHISSGVTNVQSNIPFVISDIDTPDEPVEISEAEPEDISSTATVTFTPISGSSNASSHINVSTQTRPIDLTNELIKLPDSETIETEVEHQLENNEFEDFIPENEITTQKDASKLKRLFSIKKRNAFLTTVLSFFITVLLGLAKLPFINTAMISSATVSMSICLALTIIVIVFNGNMFLSLIKAFSRSSTPDACAAITSLFTLVYAVFGIIAGEMILNILILLNIILSFRSLSTFFSSSYMLSNLKLASSNGQKKAVKLISDNTTTFAMAKNAIDGDTLIAASQKTETVNDFMKYSTYGSFLGGKLPVVTIGSLILSLLSGFACAAYFDSMLSGFYAAAAIQCFTALPIIFFIDKLPLYRASKRLKNMSAAIFGKTGAEHTQLANGVVLNSTDLFPSGTVTLHQLKVLSENSLDDTLIRAASLTEYMGSPLAPIFKTIATSGNVASLPDTDTVKYEDRMGISGWVDNRLLFIGNRTLMEAHGISVPSIEVDRKILRQGYFPVYVATRDKVCALLIVQYNVDENISRELRKLTKIGVTLLVNNTDPNLTEEMICDYLGLYSDCVKIMSAAGCHMYKTATTPLASFSAPAVHKSNPLGLIGILNCANKIHRSNIILTAAYVIAAALGAILFAYTSFAGSDTLLSDTVLLLYGLISTVISYLLYLTERP